MHIYNQSRIRDTSFVTANICTEILFFLDIRDDGFEFCSFITHDFSRSTINDFVLIYLKRYTMCFPQIGTHICSWHHILTHKINIDAPLASSFPCICWIYFLLHVKKILSLVIGSKVLLALCLHAFTEFWTFFCPSSHHQFQLLCCSKKRFQLLCSPHDNIA